MTGLEGSSSTRESQACAKKERAVWPRKMQAASRTPTDSSQQKTNKIVILPSPTQARPGTDAHALVTPAFTYMRSGSLELLLASGEHPREPHDGGVYGVAGLRC